MELSSALVVQGVLGSTLVAATDGTSATLVVAHLPTFVIGSVLYGIAFACGFKGYQFIRNMPRVCELLGKADPTEPLFVFITIYLLCYSTSIDSIETPWLIGFFAALSMTLATQQMLPEEANTICVALKGPWYFAECFLFVLTGCIIRPAIDVGLTTVLFGNFFAVLICGSLARMVGDSVVALVWQWQHLARPPAVWTTEEWRDMARRVAFLWTTTTPKATLQGTLGPTTGALLIAASMTNKAYLGPAAIVASASAVTILYCATIGTLLTFTVGRAMAAHLEAQQGAAAIQPDAEGGRALPLEDRPRPRLVASCLAPEDFEMLKSRRCNPIADTPFSQGTLSQMKP